MNNHGVNADGLQKYDVVKNPLDQLRIFHRRATVFNDDGPTSKLLEIGKRFHERIHLGASAHLFTLVDADVLFGQIGG